MGFSRQENWSRVPLPSPTYVYSHTHTFCLIYLAFQKFILFFQNYLLIRLCWVLVVACGSFSCGMLLVMAHGIFRFSSVAQSCPTLCDPMDCSTPGFPVHLQLPNMLKLVSIVSVMPSNHLIPSNLRSHSKRTLSDTLLC